MNKFDEREKSFEKKFVKDQELRFQVPIGIVSV